MSRPLIEETAIDEVLGAVHDVALDPDRYDELCETWEAVLWPQINSRTNERFETKVLSHFERAEEVLDLIGSKAIGDDASRAADFLVGVSAAAAIVVDRELTITAINPLGAQVLSSNVGAKLTDLPILQEDLTSVLRHVKMLFSDKKLSDAILRVRRQENERLIVFQLRAFATETGDRYVAAITSDIHWPESYGEILSNAFALSRAESDIARLIVDCKSVTEISELRGRSIGTVRNQIKSILAKTGSRSQIELVRLVMSVMEVTTAPEDALSAEPRTIPQGSLQESAQRFASADDGRRLEYLILGDPEGAPVFYLQTELALSLLPRYVENEAQRRGLKILSPIRAGFGQSDPIPKGVDFCTQVAKDLLTVMDAEGISAIPAISMAADNAFPARMHMLRPGSVSAIIATSGCFPFTNDQQAARQQRLHRMMHSTARYFPKLLPFVAKASFGVVRKLGKKRFVEKLFANSPADLEVFKHPEVEAAVLQGSDVALSDTNSGHETFIQQCLSYHLPGQLELLPAIQGQVPYHSMNGLKDPSMHAETLQENQQKYPWIDFHIYPDAGQWLFFQHPHDVFDLVEQYVLR